MASISMPFWNAGGSQRAMIADPVMRCFQPLDLAVLQRRREAVVIHGAIDVVLNVLLPRPHHLHWPIDLLRDAHGLLDASTSDAGRSRRR